MDNETIVISGLTRESKLLNISKIPILSELPLFGQFFRSKETRKSKVELMIFMTPHIVNNISEARALAKQKGMHLIEQLPDMKTQQPNFDPKHPLQPVPQTGEEKSP